MINNIEFIAEVKTQSPTGWKSHKSWNELFDIAKIHGDILSIHTDKRWGGSFDLLRKARQLTTKPILAKGLHQNDADIKRAVECGADYVLVVGRTPSVYQDQCIIEPFTINELKQLSLETKVMWNSRDLSKLNKVDNLKTESFALARQTFNGWLCQASNIKTIQDVDPSADAILVGTNLEQFILSMN